MSFTNRRMKRVAGPGFYLNCKFASNEFKNRRKPTNTTDVLQLHNHNTNLENFDIKEGELLFVKGTTRGYGVRVLSSLNGADYIGDDEKDAIRDLLEKYRFIGVAQTDHVANDRNQINEGLSAVVAGVVTVQNNSDKVINPGDLLKVHYVQNGNNKSIRGMPRNKKTFCLVPYTASQKNKDIDTIVTEGLTAIVVELQLGNQLTATTLNTAIAALKKKLKEKSASLQVVAKAMSYSRPGERLDILLHPRQY